MSLNEAMVKADRTANRRAEFDADNMRRFLKGLPTKEWVDDENELDEDEESTPINDDTLAADASEAEDEDEEEDPLLLESGRVLADFIELNLRSVSSIERQGSNL